MSKRLTRTRRVLRRAAAPQEPSITPPPASIARPETRPDAAELFFSSSGRLARAPFSAGMGVVLGALWLYGRWVEGVLEDATAWVVLPVLLFAGCCLTSRRLHDMGRAGWWSAYPLALLLVAWPRAQDDYRVMCAVSLAVMAVWLCVTPGQRRANRFGAPLRPAAP